MVNVRRNLSSGHSVPGWLRCVGLEARLPKCVGPAAKGVFANPVSKARISEAVQTMVPETPEGATDEDPRSPPCLPAQKRSEE